MRSKFFIDTRNALTQTKYNEREGGLNLFTNNILFPRMTGEFYTIHVGIGDDQVPLDGLIHGLLFHLQVERTGGCHS